MNEHEKDHLAELKGIDGDSLEELADFYPMLGRSAKKRILEKCLEKTDEAEFHDGITVTGTEIYSRPVWSRVMGAAAAFVAAGAVITGGVMLSCKRNNTNFQTSEVSSEIAATTTAEMTKKVTTAVTTTQAVTTTTAVEIKVETSGYIIFTTAIPFTESTTTTETTETTETTTTDVTTTTDDNEEQVTTETSFVMTTSDLTGSWMASDGNRNRQLDFFADGNSGKVGFGETGTGFSYTLTGDTITIHFADEDAVSESGTIQRISENSFEVHWFSGTTELFSRIS